MGAERERPRPARSLGELFQPAPLPRWRAVFSITCVAAALLSAGGMIEYGAGSPETQGTAVATYWALLFGLHVVAFGGAGLLAAFPALARLPLKLAWLALVATVYWLAFAVWHAHQPAATLGDWAARSSGYLPAAAAVLIGLLLPAASGVAPDAQS
jgi:hypothetical protein